MRHMQTFRNILVCGGAGFIGSNFIRHLYHAYPGYQIYNLDLLTYSGDRENLKDLEQAEDAVPLSDRRYHFIHGDICDGALLERLFSDHNFDVVVNFAAESHVCRSLHSSFDFIRTNLGGVHTLIERCRISKTPRFMQISTDEVYGDVAEGFSTEDHPLCPSNPYSASKAGADLLIKAYMRSHKLAAVIIRGSNNFGPFQYPEKLIPLAVTNFLENKKVPVHGTGENVRCWVHVMDFCRAIDVVLHQGEDGHIYNVGGTSKTNLEILTAIRQALRLDGDLDDYIIHTDDRPGADMRYGVEDEKIRQQLGWTPLQDFDQDIKDTVQWYVDQRDWWESIKEKQMFIDHYRRQERADYY